MAKSYVRRILSALLVLCLIGSAAAANLLFDLNSDGKTDISDLKQVPEADKEAALDEALGGGDELHKNADGKWEIWSSLGLYNMANLAQSGDTFVLMQDIDMGGQWWKPIENFSGKLEGNKHTISNIQISTAVDGNMGFFGSIAAGAKVEYLNLSDVNLSVSADAVNAGLLAGSCDGTIDGCTTIGFVTDERTALSGNLYIGGLAGALTANGQVIDRDVNKLPKDADETIPTISSKLGTRFGTLTSGDFARIVGIVGNAGTGTVAVGAVLQDLSGIMADPNAIAWVTNGDVTTYPHTLKELLAEIRSDGNTVVTLQADIYNDAQISIPYSCVLDCNGHTITTNPDSGNGIQVKAVGTENKVFIMKNGTLNCRVLGIRVSAGAVQVSNMDMYVKMSAAVGLYDPSAEYAELNRIEDSNLYCGNWGCIAFNAADVDFSNTGITVVNSNLVSYKAGGTSVVVKNGSATPGTVTLGDNVNLYTYSNSLATFDTFAGVDAVQLEGTETVTIDGTAYSGLNRWTTDSSIISTEVIAEVTNGEDTVQVTSAAAMVAAVAPDGNTQIKLLKDISCTSQIVLPYSCKIDLNGYSITNTSGNAIRLAGVGTENTVTRITNGTINHGTIGVRVEDGSVDLSDLTINGVGSCASSVGFYNPDGKYGPDNKIENCTIYNPNYVCIMYYGTDVDHSASGIAISNTALVASKSYAFGVTTSRMSGLVDLGEGVDIYSPKNVVANNMYRFTGLLAGKSEQKSVTLGDLTITGVNHWSTDIQKEAIDILLLGSSFSTTIPEELYKIATNAGYTVVIGNLHYPGCKSWEYWQWLNDDSPNYSYRYYTEMGFMLRPEIMTVKGALDDRQWDKISYQDGYVFDYAATLDQLYANHEEPTGKLLNYIKTNYPDAEHYFYQHWAWQVGHNDVPTVAVQEAMIQRIVTATHKFADDNDFILIPCGEAWEIARDNPLVGDTLCDTDKKHDGSAGGGQYLNGCVFFEVMFQESCIGDTWRASSGPSEEVHQELQKAAHEAVAALYGEMQAK